MKGEMVKTQIRMSDDLHDRIMRIANGTGDSLNGTMLHLIDLGLKVMAGNLTMNVVPDITFEPGCDFSALAVSRLQANYSADSSGT